MIPRIGHVIWLGGELPWASGLALHSALVRSGLERVVLHHEPGLRLGYWTDRLRAHPRFELRRLEPERLLARVGRGGGDLAALYADMITPAARANVLRLGILATEGGIYLDADTVTIRPLAPLCDVGFFCGTEPVAFPAGSVSLRSPLRLGRGIMLHGVRAALARVDGGHRRFRAVEPLFHRAANNAVLGASPDHPFTRALVDAALRLPASERRVRFALGTHLLQRVLRDAPDLGVVVHPPEVFYPLGPEISQRWFRSASDTSLAEYVHPDTRVVHWYASVSVRGVTDHLSADFVRANAASIPFCNLALPLLAA